MSGSITTSGNGQIQKRAQAPGDNLISLDEIGDSESTQLAAVSDEVREMLASHGHDVADVDRDAGELTPEEEARLAAEAGGA